MEAGTRQIILAVGVIHGEKRPSTFEDVRIVVYLGQRCDGHDLWDGAESEDPSVPQLRHVLQALRCVPAESRCIAVELSEPANWHDNGFVGKETATAFCDDISSPAIHPSSCSTGNCNEL